jgi:hypothetical protein
MTSKELHARLGATKSLTVIEYHLCTLVEARVAKLILGTELRFQLKSTRVAELLVRKWLPLGLWV